MAWLPTEAGSWGTISSLLRLVRSRACELLHSNGGVHQHECRLAAKAGERSRRCLSPKRFVTSDNPRRNQCCAQRKFCWPRTLQLAPSKMPESGVLLGATHNCLRQTSEVESSI